MNTILEKFQQGLNGSFMSPTHLEKGKTFAGERKSNDSTFPRIITIDWIEG